MIIALVGALWVTLMFVFGLTCIEYLVLWGNDKRKKDAAKAAGSFFLFIFTVLLPLVA